MSFHILLLLFFAERIGFKKAIFMKKEDSSIVGNVGIRLIVEYQEHETALGLFK